MGSLGLRDVHILYSMRSAIQLGRALASRTRPLCDSQRGWLGASDLVAGPDLRRRIGLQRTAQYVARELVGVGAGGAERVSRIVASTA